MQTKAATLAHYQAQAAQATAEGGAVSEHPTSYLPAEWRGALPPDAAGRLAFSLDLPDGSVARYTLSAEHAQHLRETLDPASWGPVEYDAASLAYLQRNQSNGSALMPSSPKSAPSDGVNT